MPSAKEVVQDIAAVAQLGAKIGEAVASGGATLGDLALWLAKNWHKVVIGLFIVAFIIVMLPVIVVLAVFGFGSSSGSSKLSASNIQYDSKSSQWISNIDDTSINTLGENAAFYGDVIQSEIGTAQDIIQSFKYEANWSLVFTVAQTRKKAFGMDKLDLKAASDAVQKGQYKSYLTGQSPYQNLISDKQWEDLIGQPLASKQQEREKQLEEARNTINTLFDQTYSNAKNIFGAFVESTQMTNSKGSVVGTQYKVKGCFPVASNYNFPNGTFLNRGQRTTISGLTQSAKDAMLKESSEDSYARIYAKAGTPIRLPETVKLTQIEWDSTIERWAASFQSLDNKRMYKFVYIGSFFRDIQNLIGSHDVKTIGSVNADELNVTDNMLQGKVIGYVGNSFQKSDSSSVSSPCVGIQVLTYQQPIVDKSTGKELAAGMWTPISNQYVLLALLETTKIVSTN